MVGQSDRHSRPSVFLVGAPRSGTTLLQSLLASHSKIISIPETHLFDHVLAKHAPFRFLEEDEFGSYLNILKTDTPQLDQQGQKLLEIHGDAVSLTNSFKQFMTLATREADALTWIEKTPDHIFHIPAIKRHFPEAVFIHLLRHPSRTLPSLFKAKAQWSAEKKSWLNTAAHWLKAYLTSAKYVGRPGHYFISFESLAANPEETLTPLLGWLGFSWEADILSLFKSTAKTLVSPTETWKQTNVSQDQIVHTSVAVTAPVFTRPLNHLYDLLTPWYLKGNNNRED
jgi:hypothetical protein